MGEKTEGSSEHVVYPWVTIPPNKTIPSHFEVRVWKFWCINVDFEVWRVMWVNSVKVDFLKLSVILLNRLARIRGCGDQVWLNAGLGGFCRLFPTRQ